MIETPTTAFTFPAFDVVLQLGPLTVLDLELITDGTLALDIDVVHDELHTACLTSAVFFGAVLAERTPLEVAAGIDGLVEEAHRS